MDGGVRPGRWAQERNLLALRKQRGTPGQDRCGAKSVFDRRVSIEKGTTVGMIRITISVLQKSLRLKFYAELY